MEYLFAANTFQRCKKERNVMKNFKKLLAAAVAGLVVASAQVGTASDLYNCNELSLDLFGYTASRDKGGGNHQAWGPGVGVNYFFNEYLGVGADSYADAFVLPYLLNGSAILRYPINRTPIAVYGFGGFGREWTHAPQWMEYLGGGGEYRFGHNTGAFLDIRGVFPNETDDYWLLRFGFRITFK
jgi:hypothetical protein